MACHTGLYLSVPCAECTGLCGNRYLEIYNENIYDLLAPSDTRGKKLKACEGDSRSRGAVSVLNLSSFQVNSAEVGGCQQRGDDSSGCWMRYWWRRGGAGEGHPR